MLDVNGMEGVLRFERRIAAPPEVVFSFFTDPDLFIQWFGLDAELDPRPGGRFRVRATGRSHLVVSGEFVEIDPPTRLVYTWGWEPLDEVHHGVTEVAPGSTTVEIELVPHGEDGTILRLRHSGLPTRTACEFHSMGWDMTLDRLMVAASGGDPGPFLGAEL
jgi:uncharacterized protein YndB with AHSA1/START domain